ncbi:MAG: hypothetical protein JNM84_12255 [Planctomycetes bacterium]|nr:hypothetical protein [Planctomycetota bacterium]
MSLRRIVPLLHVESIEAVLPFWVEKLGFRPAMQINEGAALGFVLLARDSSQVMLQSRASVRRDTPALADLGAPGSGLLYLEVQGLDTWIAQLGDVPVRVPLRRTSYGAREIAVADPAGHTVVLAEFA